MNIKDLHDMTSEEFFAKSKEDQKKTIMDWLKRSEFDAYVAGAKILADILIFSAKLRNETSIPISTVEFFSVTLSSSEISNMMFNSVIAPDNSLKKEFLKWKEEYDKKHES